MQSPTEWNLKLLYKSDTDPQIEKDRKEALSACKEFVDKWKENKKFLTDPKTLSEAIKEYEEFIANHGYLNKSLYYTGLRLSLESDNEKLLALYNKLHEDSVKIGNDLIFFTNGISKIPQKTQKKFLEYKPLEKYRHYLERTFIAGKYLLSDQEEKILNITDKTSSSNWAEMVSEFLSKETRLSIDEAGKTKERTLEELETLQKSANENVRKEAAKNFNDILKKHTPVATKEINSILEHKKNIDNLRKYIRPDQERFLVDDIETEVVENLIKTVQKAFKTSHKYYSLKAKLLKKKKLFYYERNVKIGEIKESFSYEKAKDIVLSTFKNLDKEVYSLAKLFFDEGRIDAFPKKGKVGGAFSTGVTIILPSYIMLNHNNEANDVMTMAHELGHGLNNEFLKKRVTELNYAQSTATAEVASTFFEDFALDTLKHSANAETKFALLFEKLNEDISTIHRQVAAYLFELELHESFRKKGYLSSENIGELFKKHMTGYLGPSVMMEEGAENWWVHWNHFRNFFYVYSYASGLIISKSLQAMVKRDPKNISKVKEFLSVGINKSPKDIFLQLGINITKDDFWNAGLQEIDENIAEAEILAKELGKI